MKRRNIPTSSPFGAEFGYSRAVRVDRDVHVAGTCAQPPDDQGDAYEQARGALQIIANALDETGANLDDVVRTVVYITDVTHAAGVHPRSPRGVWRDFAGFDPGHHSCAAKAASGRRDRSLRHFAHRKCVNKDRQVWRMEPKRCGPWPPLPARSPAAIGSAWRPSPEAYSTYVLDPPSLMASLFPRRHRRPGAPDDLVARSPHRQQQVMRSMAAFILAIFFALLWLLFASRLAWGRRLRYFGGAVLVIALGIGLIRIKGMSGDFVPVLEWRWSTKGEATEVEGGDATALDARDWPQFLGPERNNRLRGVHLERDWTKHPPREIWRRPVGAAWSSFAIVGGPGRNPGATRPRGAGRLLRPGNGAASSGNTPIRLATRPP